MATSKMATRDAEQRGGVSRAQLAGLFVLTFLLMLPETLPVPVLRGLVV